LLGLLDMHEVSTEGLQRSERERRLAEHIASATQSLREERDRLARRLADLERELATLAARLERSAFATPAESGRRRL
jgi:ABC-type phosphate transport system auxiliary subunit